MNIIHNQNPSTLALLEAEDDDLRLSCLSSSSKERLEEHARGGRRGTPPDHLGGETGSGGTPDGGDGEKLNLGTGQIMPFRLGDLDICFPEFDAGSCRGNRHEYFKSCIIFRCSTTVLMVGLSDGSFWRHLWAMSDIVLAALEGNRPLSWGSMINDRR